MPNESEIKIVEMMRQIVLPVHIFNNRFMSIPVDSYAMT